MRNTLGLTALLATAGSLAAQTLQPPFAGTYSFVDLGSPPGVPANLGGVAFSLADQNSLYVCGGANGAAGAVYRIAVTRDGAGHINGFRRNSTTAGCSSDQAESSSSPATRATKWARSPAPARPVP